MYEVKTSLSHERRASLSPARSIRELREQFSWKQTIDRVTAQTVELRRRLEEVQHLNDLSTTDLEFAANEILHLRTQNDQLRADLAFDHSELLFLKLQLRSLEVQAGPLVEQMGEESLLAQGMERWKLDWNDVDERLRSRRDKYAQEKSEGKEREGVRSPVVEVVRPAVERAQTCPDGLDAMPATAIEVNEEEEDMSTDGFNNACDDITAGAEKDVKTPWEELWEGLQAWAGIYDYDA